MGRKRNFRVWARNGNRFFLLSGFVIGLSSLSLSKLTFREYFFKRFWRIYFPFFIVILLSITISFFQGSLEQKFSFLELSGNILMLQDINFVKPGTLVRPFLANFPLWTLTYQWWFYILFFAAYKTIFKSPYRLYIVTALSVASHSIYLVFPNQLSLILTYFSIWWAGLELAELYLHKKEFTFSQLKPIFIMLLSLTLLSFISVLSVDEIRLGLYPFLIFRHFSDALFSVFVVWFVIKYNLGTYGHLISPFAKVAPISYGLFIFHFPLLVQFQGFTFMPTVLSEFLKLIILVSLAFLVEVKLQPIVNRLTR